ncbi:MAG: hypothetical protein AAF762_06545 [Pseudomonadota bacterium]
MKEDRIPCRTPNAGGVTSVPAWKFDLIRAAILSALEVAGADGLSFQSLRGEVKGRLPKDKLSQLGSVGWHTTTVKLELEVRGEVLRQPGVTPQRLVRGLL